MMRAWPHIRTSKPALRVHLAAAALIVAGAPAQAQDATKTIPGISMASDLFLEVCVENREDIATLIEVLPSQGYKWNADSKRFAHPTHDLSFALLQSELGFACFMEFANHVDAVTSAAIFTRKTASREVNVNIGFPEEASERNYVQATVAAEATLTQ